MKSSGRCYAIIALLALAIRTSNGFQTSQSRATLKFVQPQQRSTTKTPQLPTLRRHDQSTSLQAISPLDAASARFGSFAILALIVVVHELGHYLAAKRIGVAVEEFSVGFGPKLFGFTRANGDEFNLRAFPLGGYVRFPENYNGTAVAEQRRLEFEAQDKFMKQRNRGIAWKIANILTVGILEDREWNQEKERRAQAEAEETKRINASLFRKLLAARKPRRDSNGAIDTSIEYYDDPDLLQNRPWTQRAQVISGGVVFNLIFAFILYFGQIGFGAGIPIPQLGDGIRVDNVNIESPANGKLEKGDIILRANGSPLKVDSMVGKNGVYEFISMIQSVPDGQKLDLTILHYGKERNIQVTPRRAKEGALPSIGVLLSPNVSGIGVLKSDSPLTALRLAYKYISTLTVETTKGYGMVIGGLFSGSGTAGLSGPVGLINEGSKVVSQRDWTSVILFASAISVNLAVLNSLPLPALDGGQMVFILTEALTGRKVDQEIEERVTSAAVLFLIMLSLVIFAGDLSSL
jgi:membrane-associated protease RseP (regulator of RpoE activity)